jgi:homocysteine S-methyltransferase
VPAQDRFLERLQAGPAIVGDGGMGALLSAAVPRLRSPEEANLRAPEAVVSLHVSFINAGAQLIETNTFGANRRKLAHHFLEDDLEALNSAGVKLAREAREVTGREVFIAGSIGPLGEPAASRVRRDLFAEVATVLDGRGVDLFMVETFYDLEEVVDAVEAVRSVSSLPIVALLTFDESAETLAGVTAAEAAARLATSMWRPSARTMAPACSPRSPRCRRWAQTASRLPPSQTSGWRALPAGASSIRTRRRSTSRSSLRTRATSVPR